MQWKVHKAVNFEDSIQVYKKENIEDDMETEDASMYQEGEMEATKGEEWKEE